MSLLLTKRCRLIAVGLGALLAWAALPAQAATVMTAHGEVEVPDAPERVVTLYEGALDAVLAVGVTPVGAVTTRGGDGVADYIEAHLGDERLSIVGVVREINLEAVLTERPDLILAAPRLPDEQYALLSRIAPTVVPPSQGLSAEGWKDETRLFGQALGRAAEADEAVAAVEQRAAALAEELEAANVDGSSFLVRWMPAGPMVMSTQLFATGVMAEAGLAVEDAGLIREDSAHSDILSLENLSIVDGDWLFLATLNEDGQAALDAAKQSSAFRRLDVVQNERVIPVDGQLWSSASGPLAAQAILDDMEEILLP